VSTISHLMRLLLSDDGFVCPHCGHTHSLSDTEYSVVSYWGDDLHDFTCNSCDGDFIVRENVTRKFETAVSADATEWIDGTREHRPSTGTERGELERGNSSEKSCP